MFCFLILIVIMAGFDNDDFSLSGLMQEGHDFVTVINSSSSDDENVKTKEGLWAFIHGKSRFSGLQSPLGITNGNRSHNKPLELI